MSNNRYYMTWSYHRFYGRMKTCNVFNLARRRTRKIYLLRSFYCTIYKINIISETIKHCNNLHVHHLSQSMYQKFHVEVFQYTFFHIYEMSEIIFFTSCRSSDITCLTFTNAFFNIIFNLNLDLIWNCFNMSGVCFVLLTSQKIAKG